MLDDDNDPTPHDHIVTDSERIRHFAQYPPGTPGVRDTIPLPRGQFEFELNERVKSLEDSRRFWRWVAGLGIPALLSAAIGVMLFAADRIYASAERVGETRAQIAALSEQIKSLKEEVLMLLKLSGIDKKAGISISHRPPASSSAGAVLTAARQLTACGSRPCTTDSQCSDIFSSCRVCYLGVCTSTLPADPASAAGRSGVTPQVHAPYASPFGSLDLSLTSTKGTPQ